MSINPSTSPGYVPPSPAPYASYPPPPPPPAGGTGAKIPILFGAIVALLGANGYLFYQMNNLKTDLGKTQNSILAELDKVREASAVTTQTSKRSVDTLRDQLETERRQARLAVGDAKSEALRRVEETKRQLVSAQEAAQLAVNSKISEVKQVADTATTKISEVGTEVTSVKSDVASTKSELEKTVADLKRVGGDHDLLRELAGLCADECPKLMAEIRGAVARKDAAKLRIAAHTLKGSVATFAADEAAAAAQRLEEMGRGGRWDGVDDALAAVEAAVGRLRPALDALHGG